MATNSGRAVRSYESSRVESRAFGLSCDIFVLVYPDENTGAILYTTNPYLLTTSAETYNKMRMVKSSSLYKLATAADF